MNNNNIIPMRICKNCARCVVTGNLYECWIEDYFRKVEPYDEACDIYLDRARAEREHLKWLKENCPELIDETTGKTWKDTATLFEKMEKVERRLNKDRKIVGMPRKPQTMSDEENGQFKEIFKILSEFWNVGKEGRALKIREFSRSRLDPDDPYQLILKKALLMLEKGESYEDILIYILCEGEEKEYGGESYSLLHNYFRCFMRENGYDEFVDFAMRIAPNNKRSELLQFIETSKG